MLQVCLHEDQQGTANSVHAIVRVGEGTRAIHFSKTAVLLQQREPGGRDNNKIVRRAAGNIRKRKNLAVLPTDVYLHNRQTKVRQLLCTNVPTGAWAEKKVPLCRQVHVPFHETSFGGIECQHAKGLPNSLRPAIARAAIYTSASWCFLRLARASSIGVDENYTSDVGPQQAVAAGLHVRYFGESTRRQDTNAACHSLRDVAI